MVIKNKHIYVNRGDAFTLTVYNNTDRFHMGDYLTFSICEENNYNNVLFSKRVDIPTETYEVNISLTSEETRLGEPLKAGEKNYWYEIELNGNTTLVGYDRKGPKLLTLYPEAGKKVESNGN